MTIQKYRVVCSQPEVSDVVYIDIAPDNGTTHDQIFFSRMMLHRQNDNRPLSRLYGSIYLEDDDGKIAIDFPPPQARKDSPEYQGIMKQYAALEHQIIERYNNMRQSGRESTLYIYGINQMYELSESKNAEADAFERRRRKKMGMVAEKTGATATDKEAQTVQIPPEPKTPQEEERIKQAQQFAAARERRITGEQKRSAQQLAAWQRFQKDYSGD